MGLLLSEPNLADLGVDQQADDSGLLPQLLQVSLNALAAVSILLAVVAESLLLALVPTVWCATQQLLHDVLLVAQKPSAMLNDARGGQDARAALYRRHRAGSMTQ